MIVNISVVVKNAKDGAAHCVGDASEIKRPGYPPPELFLFQFLAFYFNSLNWMPHPWRFHGWAAMPMGSGDFADVKLRFSGLID
jgi:hypothetical protein